MKKTKIAFVIVLSLVLCLATTVTAYAYTAITFTSVSSSNCENGFTNEKFAQVNPNPLGGGNVEAFVKGFKTYAQQASNISGIPVKTILAIWGQESLWGCDEDVNSWQNFGCLSAGGRYDISTSGPFAEYDGVRCFAKAWGYWFQDNEEYYPDLIDYLDRCDRNGTTPSATLCARYIADGNYGDGTPDSYYNTIVNRMDMVANYL